jgi:hypothetical protein
MNAWTADGLKSAYFSQSPIDGYVVVGMKTESMPVTAIAEEKITRKWNSAFVTRKDKGVLLTFEVQKLQG